LPNPFYLLSATLEQYVLRDKKTDREARTASTNWKSVIAHLTLL
jgi:hypothetical protein